MKASDYIHNTGESVTIEFRNVGPGKRTWRDTFKVDVHGRISEREMEKSIRRNRALASRTIEFCEADEDETVNTIVVGGFRVVGEWEIIEPEVAPAPAAKASDSTEA